MNLKCVYSSVLQLGSCESKVLRQLKQYCALVWYSSASGKAWKVFCILSMQENFFGSIDINVVTVWVALYCLSYSSSIVYFWQNSYSFYHFLMHELWSVTIPELSVSRLLLWSLEQVLHCFWSDIDAHVRDGLSLPQSMHKRIWQENIASLKKENGIEYKNLYLLSFANHAEVKKQCSSDYPAGELGCWCSVTEKATALYRKGKD